MATESPAPAATMTATVSTPATKPTPAPAKAPESHVAAATALVTRRGLAGKLAPADADSFAAGLVKKHGLDAVLAAIAGLSDAKITRALKTEKNLGGYLYTCMDTALTKATVTESALEPAPAPATKPAPSAPSAPPTPPSPGQAFKTEETASDEEAYRREVAAENQREQEQGAPARGGTGGSLRLTGATSVQVTGPGR